MKYTIKQFQEEFPNDTVCLEYLFNKRFEKECGCGGTFYRNKKRKSYVCSRCNQNASPTKGTIMEKSSTALTLWFYAIYLFSVSKNGVSAKELQRQLGVTYKCAWRIANKIRSLMKGDNDLLTGTVEVDETYFGGRRPMSEGRKTKSALMGMVERGGRTRINVIPNIQTHIVLNQIRDNVSRDAKIMSDEYSTYKKLSKFGYQSQRVKHGKGHYVNGNIHTNTIEGFWSQLKRGSKRNLYPCIS